MDKKTVLLTKLKLIEIGMVCRGVSTTAAFSCDHLPFRSHVPEVAGLPVYLNIGAILHM